MNSGPFLNADEERNWSWWHSNPQLHDYFELVFLPVGIPTPVPGCRYRLTTPRRSSWSESYHETAAAAVEVMWNTMVDWEWFEDKEQEVEGQ